MKIYFVVISMKEVYIILSHSGTIISKIIKIYTRARYSHVSLGFGPELNEFFSFGRKHITTPLRGGFIIEGKNRGLFQKFKKAKCKIYKVILTDNQFEIMRSYINEFLKAQHKYKYNYLGIFTTMIGLKLNRPYYYFCSQFVAEVLYKSKVWNFNKDFSLIRPKDFEQIKNATLIFEGRVCDYSIFNTF